MNELPVFEAPEGVYEKLVSEDKASFSIENLVGIRGKKPGDVIACKIIKVEQTDEEGILISLERT
jgi:hypothetical protein